MLTGSKTFAKGPWAQSPIQVLEDLNGTNSMLSFQELVTRYRVPKQSLFHYFRLHSALKSHNIQWGDNLKLSIVDLVQNSPKRIVSFIYMNLLKRLKSQDFSIKEWQKDLADQQEKIARTTIWANVASSSKNISYNLSIIRYVLERT